MRRIEDLRFDPTEPESSPTFASSQAECYRRLTVELGEVSYNDDHQSWYDIANGLGIYDVASASLDDDFAAGIGSALRRTIKRNVPPRWSIPRSKNDWIRILIRSQRRRC